MKLTPDQAVAYYESRLGESRRNGRSIMHRCAFHNDKNPSLAVDPEKGTWFCHSCKIGGDAVALEKRLKPDLSKQQAQRAVAEVSGAPAPSFDFDAGEHVATYVYRDERGLPLFESRRYQLTNGKRFEIWRYEGGKPVRGMGNARNVPLNLPGLIVARQALVVEGEKAAEALGRVLGDPEAKSVVVTTCAMGAGKWRDEFAPYFAGRDVAILPDNDDPGRNHAAQVARSVSKFARAVKIVDLPGLPEKGDVVDFLAAGGSVQQILDAIKAAPQWRAETPTAMPLTVPEWQFVATVPDRIEWLVDGVIQVGSNGVIGADPKVGKSVLAVDMLLGVASGGEWLGFRCREGRGMLISREDNPALTAWRIQHLAKARGVSPRDRIFINSRQQSKAFMLDVPGHLLDMKAEVAARQPDIVILDVLNRLHDQDENDQGNMRAVLEAAQELAWSERCSIGVVHHFRKPQVGDFSGLTGRLRGSSAIAGWFEWMVGLSIADGTRRHRRAEFEVKAAQAPEPVEFAIESDKDGGTMWVQRHQPQRSEGKWAN